MKKYGFIIVCGLAGISNSPIFGMEKEENATIIAEVQARLEKVFSLLQKGLLLEDQVLQSNEDSIGDLVTEKERCAKNLGNAKALETLAQRVFLLSNEIDRMNMSAWSDELRAKYNEIQEGIALQTELVKLALTTEDKRKAKLAEQLKPLAQKFFTNALDSVDKTTWSNKTKSDFNAVLSKLKLELTNVADKTVTVNEKQQDALKNDIDPVHNLDTNEQNS